MAVFTAIATSILGALGVAGTILGSATLFSIAVGVIATGLAAGTAKLFGVFEPPGGNSKDPGVKIQLPPGTDNKVPKMYGRNFSGAMIIDAEIKNQNKTMAYCLVLSEYSDNDNWSINKIYRGDQELVFGTNTAPGAADATWTVQSVIDPNSTASNKVAGKIRCRVYAGGSTSAHQIFPTTNPANAWTDTGDGFCQFKNWSSANTMTDLVFAVFEIDYEPEEGLTGLGAITFDINNSLNNPADVLLDYLTNTRYGANLPSALLDTASFDDWRTFSNTQVDYINQLGATAQHSRYQIDGALSTFNTAKQNINEVCLNGGAFFTFNGKTGKFGVVPNRAASTAELDNAFQFTDDNIVSSISITSSELYSLYNSIEVEYPSVNQRDQTDVYFAELGEAIRNPNEPDNTLKYRLNMCNDRARVAQLANVDINQSRVNMIMEFTADYSALQVDVGDVVKFTSDLYGYTDKLFRCMRVVENEDAEGMLTVKITLLEYDSDVYGDLITQEDLPPAPTGVTNWWIENSNAVLTLGNITVVSDPTATLANIHSSVTGSVIGTIPVANVIAEYGSVFSDTSTFINVEFQIPDNTTFNQAKVVAFNESAANSSPLVLTQAPSSTASGSASYFAPGDTYNFGIDSFNFNQNTPFRLEAQLEDTVSGSASRTFITGTLNIGERKNLIKSPVIAPGGAGVVLSRDHFVDLALADVTPKPVNSANDFVYVDLVDDTYYTAEPIDPTNFTLPLSQRYGETYPEFVNQFALSSTCLFVGSYSSPLSTAYGIVVSHRYVGNVAADNNLVEGVDYVTSNPNGEIRLPTLATVVAQGELQSIMINYAGFGSTSTTELQNVVLFQFQTYPGIKNITVYADGASTMESVTADGLRGFAVYYDIQGTSNGLFPPDIRNI